MSLDPPPLSQPFWDAAGEGRLVVPECTACGRRFFTPEVVCPHCFSGDWTWATSEGTGEVYSFTVVHRAADPVHQSDTPFVLAVVDLDDGWSLLSRLRCDVDRVHIGLRVAVQFAPLHERSMVPMFEPSSSIVGGT